MKNKYNAKKTIYKGIIYDSKYEATRAYELDMLERAGHIKDLERQKRFILQEGYINNKGENIRPISYIADFSYIDSKGNKIVEDTKGLETEVFRIKKKMFEYKYNDIKFVVLKGKTRTKKVTKLCGFKP